MNHYGVPTKFTSSNSLKPLMMLAAALIIAVTSGVGGYLLVRRSGSPLTTDHQPLPSPTPSLVAGGNDFDTSDWKLYADSNIGFALKYPSAWSQVVLKKFSGFLSTPSADITPDIALVPELPDPWNENKPRNGILFQGAGHLGYINGIEISGVHTDCTNSATSAQEEMNSWLKAKTDIPYPHLLIRPFRSNDIYGYIADNGLPNQRGNPEPGGASEVFLFRCPLLIHISFGVRGASNRQQLLDQILSTVRMWTPEKIYPG